MCYSEGDGREPGPSTATVNLLLDSRRVGGKVGGRVGGWVDGWLAGSGFREDLEDLARRDEGRVSNWAVSSIIMTFLRVRLYQCCRLHR